MLENGKLGTGFVNITNEDVGLSWPALRRDGWLRIFLVARLLPFARFDQPPVEVSWSGCYAAYRFVVTW